MLYFVISAEDELLAIVDAGSTEQALEPFARAAGISVAELTSLRKTSDGIVLGHRAEVSDGRTWLGATDLGDQFAVFASGILRYVEDCDDSSSDTQNLLRRRLRRLGLDVSFGPFEHTVVEHVHAVRAKVASVTALATR